MLPVIYQGCFPISEQPPWHTEMSYQSILDLDCNHCSPSARQLLYFEEVVFLAVLVLLLGCRQCNEHICTKLLFSGMLNDVLMHCEGLKGF